MKILGQAVFSHVRIYTENTFYSTNIFTISWANSGAGIFQPGKMEIHTLLLYRKIPVLEFLSFIYWTPLSSCNMREISVGRNIQLPFS